MMGRRGARVIVIEIMGKREDDERVLRIGFQRATVRRVLPEVLGIFLRKTPRVRNIHCMSLIPTSDCDFCA